MSQRSYSRHSQNQISCHWVLNETSLTAIVWPETLIGLANKSKCSLDSPFSWFNQPIFRLPYYINRFKTKIVGLRLMESYLVAWLSINRAPSDVNTTLDGSTYPRWKMSRFSKFHFLLQIKTQQAISGTSAATYKVMQSHCQLVTNVKVTKDRLSLGPLGRAYKWGFHKTGHSLGIGFS